MVFQWCSKSSSSIHRTCWKTQGPTKRRPCRRAANCTLCDATRDLSGRHGIRPRVIRLQLAQKYKVSINSRLLMGLHACSPQTRCVACAFVQCCNLVSTICVPWCYNLRRRKCNAQKKLKQRQSFLLSKQFLIPGFFTASPSSSVTVFIFLLL